MTNHFQGLLNYIYFRKLDAFIVFKLDLPFDLNVNFDFQEILVGDLNVDFLSKTSRNIALKSERKWQESINICGRDVVSVSIGGAINGDVKYTNSIMSLMIIIPIYDDELDACTSAFRIDDSRALLISNIMYLLRNKINEKLVEDFNLDVSLYGAERALIYKLNRMNGTLRIISGLMSPGYHLNKEKKLPRSAFNSISNDSICVWRYYANKCEIAYNLHQNLDCVLFAAIAIEAYINSVYMFNGLKSNEDNVFKSLKFLKKNNYIDRDAYGEIKSAFGKIHIYRNEIVHGKTNSIFQERKKANDAYESIVGLFSKKVPNDTNEESICYSTFKSKLSKALKDMGEKNFESAIKIFDYFLENNVYYYVSNYYLGLCYLFLNKPNKAKPFFDICRDERFFYPQALYYLSCIEKIEGNKEMFHELKKECLEYINCYSKNKTEMYINIIRDLDNYENQDVITVRLLWI